MVRFDVVIIGTGVAGRSAADELLAAGKHVAMVEARGLGGTCALRGCEPKKVLYAVSEVAERSASQRSAGLMREAGLDWGALVDFERTFVDPLPAQLEDYYVGLGATVLHGCARFDSPETLKVDGAPIAADHFLIATGAKPAPLGVPGEHLMIDSETLMSRRVLGARVVFVGGGYISFEFAHMVAASGAHVEIVHRSETLLKGFDQELVALLADGYRKRGIDVRTNAPLVEVREARGGLEVALGDGSVLIADTVVHGAGRVPDIAGLALDIGDVAASARGILVTPDMRSTSNPSVFAAGDAADMGKLLTPVGIAQARVAARNIVEPGSASFEPVAVASCVFSSPPLAAVGLSEAEARASHPDARMKFTDTSQWVSSRRVGDTVGAAKAIVDGDGTLLGAHVLGHNADEVVNVFAAAIAGGLTAESLKAVLWAYPTNSSEIVYFV